MTIDDGVNISTNFISIHQQKLAIKNTVHVVRTSTPTAKLSFYKTHDRYCKHTLMQPCLFVWCLTARQHKDRSICANCGMVKPTQAAKDGQRDTMHNSQYVSQCNTVQSTKFKAYLLVTGLIEQLNKIAC